MSTMSERNVQGGVCLVVQDQPQGWSVEMMRFHGSSVVIFKDVNDRKWTPIIDAYLPTSNLEKLKDLEEALARFREQDPIVIG